jgi:glycosyltransferase involved in cell wall biosynthesis
MKKTVQLVSCLASPDAVSNCVLTFDETMRQNGLETSIITPRLAGDLSTQNIFEIQIGQDLSSLISLEDHLIIHYSIYDEVALEAMKLPNKKTFIYHNITPEQFFVGYDEQLAELCRKGRASLAKFKSCEQVVALSKYSRDELLAYGFKQVAILPFLSRGGTLAKKISPTLEQRIIFVGKIAPHKKVEDLIKAFYLLRKFFKPQSALDIVGLLGGDLYEAEIRALIAKLQLDDCVTLHGKLRQTELDKVFGEAAVFATMSEHEGFCVPLVEAMRFQVPIVAFSAGAVCDTLGGSGIVLDSKNPGLVCCAINELLDNQNLRNEVITAQTDRFAQLVSKQIAKDWLKLVL